MKVIIANAIKPVVNSGPARKIVIRRRAKGGCIIDLLDKGS